MEINEAILTYPRRLQVLGPANHYVVPIQLVQIQTNKSFLSHGTLLLTDTSVGFYSAEHPHGRGQRAGLPVQDTGALTT